MNFADAKPDMKARIISRAWQAIRLDVREMSDDAVDELMAEWIAGLHDLHIDEIALGVKACQREGKTAPIDEFVLMCQQVYEPAPEPEPKLAPPRPARRRAKTDRSGFAETFEESYINCELDKRWGPLP